MGGGACADVFDIALTTLTSMGFDEAKCVLALQSTNNDVERAISWLLKSPDNTGDVESTRPPGEASTQAEAAAAQAAKTVAEECDMRELVERQVERSRQEAADATLALITQQEEQEAATAAGRRSRRAPAHECPACYGRGGHVDG